MGQIRNPSSTFTAAWAYEGPYYNVLTRRRGGGGGQLCQSYTVGDSG